MRKDLNLLSSMRLSALLTQRSATKPVPLRLTALSENDNLLQTAFKTALRNFGQVSEKDEFIPRLEDTWLAQLQDEQKIAFVLDEIAQRSAGQSCQPAIRQALLNIAQDRNPQTGQFDQLPHFTPAVREAAAYSLDVAGYAPPDLSEFVTIPRPGSAPFGIAKYLVTNQQYARFLTTENFSDKELWCDFPKYSRPDQLGQVHETGSWAAEGWERLQSALEDPDYADIVKEGVFLPRSWVVSKLCPPRQHVPVVGVSWFEANAYCKWLLAHWYELDEGWQGLSKPGAIRLPTGPEWLLAAGGPENGAFAWGALKDPQALTRYANIGGGRTSPVWMYPGGASQPHQLMDMTGNVREWQANFPSIWPESQSLKAGSWVGLQPYAPDLEIDDDFDLFDGSYDLGFRVALFDLAA